MNLELSDQRVIDWLEKNSKEKGITVSTLVEDMILVNGNNQQVYHKELNQVMEDIVYNRGMVLGLIKILDFEKTDVITSNVGEGGLKVIIDQSNRYQANSEKGVRSYSIALVHPLETFAVTTSLVKQGDEFRNCYFSISTKLTNQMKLLNNTRYWFNEDLDLIMVDIRKQISELTLQFAKF